MIDYEALRPYRARYAALECAPLRITLRLRPGGRLAGYDPLNLDNLLARLVVVEATAGRGLPPSDEPYCLPVPLRCLWRSPEGLPLWGATVFSPLGPNGPDVAYWHKRAQTGVWTGTKTGRFGIASTAGRWMERRVPLPTVVCDTWTADCVGNAAEIARLLALCGFVGKRRTNGFGEVETWAVEPLAEFALVRDGRLTRPVPAAAVELLGHERPEDEPAPVGWTPPEWKPSLFRPGWWSGQPVGLGNQS